MSRHYASTEARPPGPRRGLGAVAVLLLAAAAASLALARCSPSPGPQPASDDAPLRPATGGDAATAAATAAPGSGDSTPDRLDGDDRPAPAAPGGPATGRVVDEFGAPVGAFRVAVTPFGADDDLGRLPRGVDIRDADGRFRVLDACPPPWRVTVRAPGFATASIGPVDAIPPLGVRLLRPALLHGLALSPDGTPLAEVPLVCVDAETGRTLCGTWSGADGSYQLLPRAPGGFRIGVAGEPPGDEVRCATGSPGRQDVAVPAPASLTCTVTAGGGGALAGAMVTLVCDGHRSTRTTGADGVVRWAFVPRGRHRVTVDATGHEGVVDSIDTSERSRRAFVGQFELVAQPPR